MTRQFGGTGLGLAISARLVKMMGGHIWVESEVGGGSQFHFTVRFGQAQADKPNCPAEVPSLVGLPVLVVDDNATNRRFLRDVLARWGMNPTLAETAEEALSSIRQANESGQPFSLVLTDCYMPRTDGFGLAGAIKRDPQLAATTTIMMLTSGGQVGDAVRCREAGVAAYLTKPISQAELYAAMLQALGPHSRPSECLKDSGLITRHSLREKRHNLRILLAEDNPVNRHLASRLLEKRGHTVLVASTGDEALAQLEKNPVDLVLMDVQMPEMDGFEAAARIREKEKGTETHLPIVALTAHAMKGDQERCLAAGMDAYVSKPIHAEALFQAIERVTKAYLASIQ